MFPVFVVTAVVTPPPKPASWLYGKPKIVSANFLLIKPLVYKPSINAFRIPSEGNVPRPSCGIPAALAADAYLPFNVTRPNASVRVVGI